MLRIGGWVLHQFYENSYDTLNIVCIVYLPACDGLLNNRVCCDIG